MRPPAYNYLGHLQKHMDLKQAFTGTTIYPRQLQLYMPGGCNFRCSYCAGRFSKTKSIHWEETGLRLLDQLEDRIPYHQYTGCSTEPTLNPYFLRFLETTKRNGCCFGIKTNGSRLAMLEDDQRFLTRLCAISTAFDDYISISLDAGCPESHSVTKKTTPDSFPEIIAGIEWLCRIRGSCKYPAIRISYLLNEHNDSEQEIRQAISIAKNAGVDSIRFSQPHPAYLEDPEIAAVQWKEIEEKDAAYRLIFGKLSSDTGTRVFYDSPAKDGGLNFARCGYGYYQITLSQDGFLYRCTTVVGIPDLRVGIVTSDLNEFANAVRMNQDAEFDPARCIDAGVYCCRAAVAVNEYFNEGE